MSDEQALDETTDDEFDDLFADEDSKEDQESTDEDEDAIDSAFSSPLTPEEINAITDEYEREEAQEKLQKAHAKRITDTRGLLETAEQRHQELVERGDDVRPSEQVELSESSRKLARLRSEVADLEAMTEWLLTPDAALAATDVERGAALLATMKAAQASTRFLESPPMISETELAILEKEKADAEAAYQEAVEAYSNSQREVNRRKLAAEAEPNLGVERLPFFPTIEEAKERARPITPEEQKAKHEENLKRSREAQEAVRRLGEGVTAAVSEVKP